MPRGFHVVVKENYKLKTEEIYHILINEKSFKPENYSVTKEFTLQYIEKL